jgi:glycine/D-amino acid oxidase-like deaminating enzyme
VKPPFRVLEHVASVRPATLERRPFVGFHPLHPAVGILNGMGTKGCSLAPFFARQLVRYIVDGTAILPEADVRRFSKILSRTGN